MQNSLRIIGGDLVRALLDMPSCVAAMRQAFSLVSQGVTRQPIRSAMTVPDGTGLLGLMPGCVADPPLLGLKVVSIFPGNFDQGKPTHQGMVMLFDARDGRPLALLDAHAMTAIRTAAASAVATDVLARPDSAHLVLLGYGDQAATHLEAISLVRRLSKVTIWGRNPDKARAFADQWSHAAPFTVAGSVEQAIASGDIICSLTAAADPILFGRWLQPGMHINAVGASLPIYAELDDLAVAKSRFFTDYRASAEQLAGEFQRAIASGTITADHLLGEIGEVLTGQTTGRRSPDDITCFKSLGMAVEDLVAAELVLNRAIEQNLGTVVPF